MSGQYERRDKACPVSTGEEGGGGQSERSEKATSGGALPSWSSSCVADACASCPRCAYPTSCSSGRLAALMSIQPQATGTFFVKMNFKMSPVHRAVRGLVNFHSCGSSMELMLRGAGQDLRVRKKDGRKRWLLRWELPPPPTAPPPLLFSLPRPLL